MSDEQIKQKIFERIRARVGDAYVSANARFLEEQWEYAKQLGMLDPETDLAQPTESA